MLQKRALAAVIAGLAAISLMMVLATWISGRFWQSAPKDWADWPLIYKLLYQASLTQENVLAAWFSSMLLLLAACALALCFLLDRDGAERPALRFGWLLTAALFTALSLDELGSLHERFSIWGEWRGWMLLMAAFLAVIPLYLSVFALMQLRRCPRGAACFAGGVLCFTAIPVFEQFEVAALQTPEAVFAPGFPLWRALEEGTELAGMLLFLTGALLFAFRMAPPEHAGQGGSRLAVPLAARGLRAAAVLTGLIGAGGIAGTRLWQPAEHYAGADGIPENWFASVPLFLAAVILLACDPGGPGRRMRLALCLAALFLSAYLGSNWQVFFWPGQSPGLQKALTLLLLLPLIAAAAGSAGRRARTAACGASLALLAVFLLPPGAWVAPAGLAAAAVFAICAVPAWQSGAAPPRPDSDRALPSSRFPHIDPPSTR
ncbi:hypothetical protein ACUXV3_09280 [Roseobacteraceae bacterium NS-SX3]